MNTEADGNLELTGDVGGDDGAGTSASSSSSSSHSSSLRGVMLFPSHTEWMDTFKGHKTGGRRSGPEARGAEPQVLPGVPEASSPQHSAGLLRALCLQD